MNKEEINLLTITLFLNYYKKDITERYVKCIDNIALDNNVLYTNEKVFITTLEKYIELHQENKELHNKIDKTIEYIETATIDPQSMRHYRNCLLEILKDSDVDENK